MEHTKITIVLKAAYTPEEEKRLRQAIANLFIEEGTFEGYNSNLVFVEPFNFYEL